MLPNGSVFAVSLSDSEGSKLKAVLKVKILRLCATK